MIMPDKSLYPVAGSSHETAASVGSSHEQSPYLLYSRSVGKSIPREATSATSSTNPSRESSPIRFIKPHLKKSNTTYSSGPSHNFRPSRSSKNNSKISLQQNRSVRSTNIPSSATTRRALSAATAPTLNPFPSDILSVTPHSKTLLKSEARGDSCRSSLRRRSSPPSFHQTTSHQGLDDESTSYQSRAIKTTNEAEEKAFLSDPEELSSHPGMRTPVRGVSGASSTLETVQEISQPNTPRFGNQEKLEVSMVKSTTGLDSQGENDSLRTIRAKPSVSANESDHESAGRKEVKLRAICTNLPGATRSITTPAKSFMTAGIGRGKPSGEGSSQKMTVETETVSSISQIAVGPGGLGNSGSIRTKPSCETIRPKKEKKKTIRKPPSLTSGTASSKADIFEAKVASAVDEANSSDSEETFVYESNPPDSNDRPRLFHSRTPSAASMVSQVDPRIGIRAIKDGHQIIVMKKSMKFANSYNSNGPEPTTSDDTGKGTVRNNTGIGRGVSQHHHMNSRWGRHAGSSHPSLFDNESAFTNATTSKFSETGHRLPSRPVSPRSSNRMTANTGNYNPHSEFVYRPDNTVNERTSLLKTSRIAKSPQSIRQNRAFVQLEHQTSRPLLTRRGGCLALFAMMLIVITGIAAFIFVMTRPLFTVEILALNNVYATENLLFFEMKVQARNPNLIAVTIESTDLAISVNPRFSTLELNNNRNSQLMKRLCPEYSAIDYVLMNKSTKESVDTTPVLEIGHVNMLDSPLKFEGSPFRDTSSISVGRISILDPGYSSNQEGRKCWKKIIKYDFNLFIRGRLNYTPPFSQKRKSTSVEFQTLVEA